MGYPLSWVEDTSEETDNDSNRKPASQGKLGILFHINFRLYSQVIEPFTTFFTILLPIFTPPL